jgi:beta-lactamase regulating signal transducer with metallopeptidase domain
MSVVERLALGLIHFIWEGVLIAALLAVVLVLFRGRPRTRHAAAWLGLLAMACAVPLTAWQTPGAPRSLTASAAPPPAGSPAIEPAGTAALAGTLGAQPAAPESRAASVSPPVPMPANTKLGPVAASASLPPAHSWTWRFPLRDLIGPAAPWAVRFWVAGVVLLSLWRLGGWFSLGRLYRRETRMPEAATVARFEGLAGRLGVGRGVRLLESAWVEVPSVVGWLRPVVLLPAELAAGMAPGQLELILAHELAHIRRHDFLANLVQTAIETCLFYHPAVWWVSRVIRAEREACCDDLVVAATGERLLYARALAEVAQLRTSTRAARLALAASDGDLLGRIRRILGLPCEGHRWVAPQLAASAGVLALSAGLTGYLALAEGQVPPAAPPAAKAKAQAAAEPRDDGAPPKIVALFPAEGAVDVPSTTELRIRFDRPMEPDRAVLEWEARGPAGCRPLGPLRYAPETFEFSLPVQLTPGQKHQVSVNREGFNPAKKRDAHEGFQSAAGVAAVPVRWSFTTTKPPAREGAPPRVTAVDPPNDTEVALVTPIELTFDRPMDPAWYGLEPSGVEYIGRRPEFRARPEYDPANRRFTLLMKLPAHWNGELKLVGFRDADGIEAEPVVLKYRTLREVLSPAIGKRADEAGRSPELLRLVDRVRQARRKITSVSERAQMLITTGLSLADWTQRFECSGATFTMKGDRQFLGEIDAIMKIPFRIGSDGTTCWFRRQNERFELPFDQVDEKRLLFCDPFEAGREVDSEQVIRDLKLELLADGKVDGRQCHRIRSWAIETLQAPDFLTPLRVWSIDAETLLPLQVEMDHRFAFAFTPTRINEPIADAVFRPETGPDIEPKPAEALPEGFNKRFLSVIDGSNGRMSVRWGMHGPKGRSSSGLN